jgi:hypothetical protein
VLHRARMRAPRRIRHGLILILAGCAPNAREEALLRLQERYGPDVVRGVAFRRDSTHLLVQLDSAALGSLSDSAFAAKAREVAALALATYPRSHAVDSVTVSVGEMVVPRRMFRITREFSAGSREFRE